VKLVFSGDLGQPRGRWCATPPIEDADVLVVESTYGNRNHRSMPRRPTSWSKRSRHARAPPRQRHRPAFALGRTQD